MGVSENGGTPKSSILIGFSIIINHPFWGIPIFGNTHMCIKTYAINIVIDIHEYIPINRYMKIIDWFLEL